MTLGLKAKFLSWKTGQKERCRMILTFSLFQLPWITKKYMLRIKTVARYMPTSTLFTGLQDTPQRIVSLTVAIESPVYLAHQLSFVFWMMCKPLWNVEHSTQYIARYVWIYWCTHVYFSKDVDMSLLCIALSGAQGSLMIMVSIMQAEVINPYISWTR